jgi:hypothetical protein
MEDTGPYTTCFSLPTRGIIKQELITYEIKDGMLRRVTTIREFTKDDYVDYQVVEPLCAAKENHD